MTVQKLIEVLQLCPQTSEVFVKTSSAMALGRELNSVEMVSVDEKRGFVELEFVKNEDL